MNELVERLSKGSHPVVVSLRPDNSLENLQAAIKRRYVHIKFTDTQGGTELGVRLDESASNWQEADFTDGKGTIQLVGDLTLNYEKVKCLADIDLETLAGQGHLNVLQTSADPSI
ncbi:hypothetical protein PN498_15520 [Oscillatoria sp. CS-180]|uniref:hypothetical protein n=1 Tax=Oscillatoria sp. CS-180 TaxID=3021720 RepID=UPI00232A7FD4|nr:hypothetical protein [Oscillatoria sp. CS-180]MDB9527407.1 hypothetical protein [Oscillatoria sp. CS-180]